MFQNFTSTFFLKSLNKNCDSSRLWYW